MTRGHSGRNREEHSKAKADGRETRGGERERGRESGAKAMKWNELFDLPRTGQVLGLDCLIWFETPAATQKIHSAHT